MFYPGNGLFDRISDVPFYLAICPELVETYRILHRVGGLFVVLWSQIDVGLRIFGFPIFRGVITDMRLCVLEVNGLPHVRQSMTTTIRSGRLCDDTARMYVLVLPVTTLVRPTPSGVVSCGAFHNQVLALVFRWWCTRLFCVSLLYTA